MASFEEAFSRLWSATKCSAVKAAIFLESRDSENCEIAFFSFLFSLFVLFLEAASPYAAPVVLKLNR
jgi:hypothetical protein